MLSTETGEPKFSEIKFFLRFILMWIIFNVFIEFVTVLFLYYVWGGFFGHEACGILARWRGTKLTPPALEGKVLTTGPPGNSLNLFFNRGNKPNDIWGPVCVCAAAPAKSLQSCLTLCDPIDGSPPGSPVPRILQARTLEWVAISSPMHESEKWKWSCSVMSNSLRPHRLQPSRLLHPWDFPGKSTGVGCHCLLQCVCVVEWYFKVRPSTGILCSSLNLMLLKPHEFSPMAEKRA